MYSNNCTSKQIIPAAAISIYIKPKQKQIGKNAMISFLIPFIHTIRFCFLYIYSSGSRKYPEPLWFDFTREWLGDAGREVERPADNEGVVGSLMEKSLGGETPGLGWSSSKLSIRIGGGRIRGDVDGVEPYRNVAIRTMTAPMENLYSLATLISTVGW